MAKLLIIDDDAQFRAFMEEALTDSGYEVYTAENGVLGLECVNREQPDIVITDIVMPEKEGVEVILELKQAGDSVPVIAMSGGNLGNSNSYLHMAKKLGAAAVIAKPFQLEDLIAEINKILD